jgi:cation transport ATPase
MRRRPFQMSFRQRCWLYSAFAVTVGSGGTWAIIWHFFREEADMAMPVENTLMKIHLAVALILLVAVGAALPKHASKSWDAKINRPASTLFLLSILGAAVTGYGILAFVWESQVMHFTHIALGVTMTLLLPGHIFIGRYLEKKRIAARHRGEH